MTPEKSLATRLEEALALKVLGNDQYERKKFAVAITHYKDAIMRLPPRNGTASEADEPDNVMKGKEAVRDADQFGQQEDINKTDNPLLQSEVTDLRSKIYTNLAAAHLKLVCTKKHINDRGNTRMRLKQAQR